MLKKLHHNAYGCIDSEQTRKFYEDFLGLPLVCSLWLNVTKSGRPTEALHTFYRLEDGSCLAFFEEAEDQHQYKDFHDFELHIALEPMMAKGRAAGVETRGISDHDFIESIYFRDPNGYVIELCAKREHHDEAMNPAKNDARAILDRWQAKKELSAESRVI
jgi:catechol 2,3-dioxygenase-like lactoylglutathione lyase family enzyme